MSDMDNQEVVDNEEITENAEATPSSPASELVDLVLSGDLHAANEKFKGIVEANVIESIEDEKLKIAQTLFAEEPEEDDDEKEEDDDDDKDDDDKDDKKDVDEDLNELSSKLIQRAADKAHDKAADLAYERDKRRHKEGQHGTKLSSSDKGGSNELGDKSNKKVKQGRRLQRAADDRRDREDYARDMKDSFDPGEATIDAPLPENSFVQQIAQHLSGNRK